MAIGVYAVVQHLPAILGENGCQAGTGHTAVPLDPDQAAIAATIAGVAHHQRMPARAVTVAYAAAMQESHMHDLDYGDRDSVGVFQQRPSQGWGPASKIMNPVYASTRFFQALALVHGYQRLPVYRAAQAVQRSADGYAYSQYQPTAVRLTTAFTGASPHAVWCWSPGPRAGKTRFASARKAMVQTFGPLYSQRSGTPGDAPSLLVRAPRPHLGWAIAAWLVTHAGQYRFGEVSYAGFRWRAASGHAGWTKDKGASGTAVLAN
jgi:hypothetical protein